jgi:predicted DNA-binding ArsR family transcriptional regulator
MPNPFDDLVNTAGQMADDHFRNRLSTLTSLADDDVAKIITDTGISQEDLSKVLQEIKNAASDNEAAAQNISNINKGVGVLVAIVKKFI